MERSGWIPAAKERRSFALFKARDPKTVVAIEPCQMRAITRFKREVLEEVATCTAQVRAVYRFDRLKPVRALSTKDGSNAPGVEQRHSVRSIKGKVHSGLTRCVYATAGWLA